MIEVNESNVSKPFTRIAVSFGDESFNKVYEDVLFYLKLNTINTLMFDSVQTGFPVYSKGNQTGISHEDLQIASYNKFLLKTRNSHKNFGIVDVNQYISSYFNVQHKVAFCRFNKLRLKIHIIPQNPEFTVYDDEENSIMSSMFFNDKDSLDDKVEFMSIHKGEPFYVIEEFFENLNFKSKINISLAELKEKLFDGINILICEKNLNVLYRFLLSLSNKVFGFIFEKGVNSQVVLMPISAISNVHSDYHSFIDTLLAIECFMSFHKTDRFDKLGALIHLVLNDDTCQVSDLRKKTYNLSDISLTEVNNLFKEYSFYTRDLQIKKDLPHLKSKGCAVSIMHLGNLNDVMLIFKRIEDEIIIHSVYSDGALIYDMHNLNVNKFGKFWKIYLLPRKEKSEIDLQKILSNLKETVLLGCDILY